ncbi:hypothetical protein D3C78_1811500 [compost metagenome]
MLIHRGRLCADQPVSDLLLRQERMLVRYRGSALPGFTADGDGMWRDEVPRERLWPVLQAIADAGGQLLESRPAQSLEQLFVDVIGERQ